VGIGVVIGVVFFVGRESDVGWGKVLSFPNRILSLASSSRVELAEKGKDWGTNT
jgi:hypothetical protein